MKKLLSLTLVLVMLASLAGCSGSDKETDNATVSETTETTGFTLDNAILGETYSFTYEAVPTKVVSLASPATEMLLALGLEEHIAGYAFQENVIPENIRTHSSH